MEALFAGYLAGVLVYALALLLITRLGRKVLMEGDVVSNLYTALLAAAWFAASLAGGYVCCHFSPLAPYGTIGFPVMLAVVFGGLVIRNARQLSGQQSLFSIAAICAMILLGTAGALKLSHAFMSTL